MDLELLLALGGLGAIVLGALRFNREDAGRAVEQMDTIADNLRADLDRTRGDLETCRKERRQIEANLRACRHRQESLEQHLIELGEEVPRES